MRLAFISTILGYPWGGADTLWTHAAEAAGKQGDALFISVSPAVAAHARIAALAAQGASLHLRSPSAVDVSFKARLLRKLGLHSPDANLIAALRTFRPDRVVFSQGGTYDLLLHPQLAAWLRSSGTKYRIIANWQQEHPQLDETQVTFIRKAFAAADGIAFVSTRNLNVTRKHLGMPLPNVQVIQNPLRWQPSDLSPWPIAPVARLATVSRLDEGKGIQLLLEALAETDTALPEWRLAVFGRGPHETRLRETSAQLGLGERVEFRGHVSELRSIWAENQLMISPALDDGVPMTIPEAMFCQRPVLATCVGGAEDWLSSGQTGFLCATPTASQLAASLREAFSARERWEAMGKAAAIAARERYRPTDYLQLIAP